MLLKTPSLWYFAMAALGNESATLAQKCLSICTGGHGTLQIQALLLITDPVESHSFLLSARALAIFIEKL